MIGSISSNNMKRVISTAFALAIYSSISFGQTDTTYLEGLKGLGNHKGGKKDGHWTLFYLTNQKQSEGVYKSGLPEGHWTNWYKNGSKYYEGNYHNGKKEGPWIVRDSLGRIMREENFINDIRDGIVKEWHHDKDEFTVGTIKNETMEGSWEWRTITADRLKMKGEFKNGMKNGMFIFYYPDGQIESKGEFKDGKEEGEHVWYNKNGTIYTTVNYKNGQVVK